MKIRSVTAFLDVRYPLETELITSVSEALRAVCQKLEDTGFEVQTTRLATQPFASALGDTGPTKARDLAQDLEALAFVHEIDFVSLGPVRLGHSVAHIEVIDDILSNTEKVFVGVEIANPGMGVSLPRARRVGEIIRHVASITSDGFANLRLAALANVPAWSPFFPAAYHGGGKPRVAIATESADLAVAAVTSAHSMEDVRKGLVSAIEAEAERVETAVKRTLRDFDLEWQGIDFSLAPFPTEESSIGGAMEQLGLPGLGAPGTLAAAAFLTDCIDQAQFKRTGFSGLMLPVLEDSVLAIRAAEGRLTINELLTYSAVCGTGLDTIPLPGDTSPETLAAILIDVGALALRLDKPLTARLMPLPGKAAGDPTEFEFEYFANSRVMTPYAVQPEGGDGLSGLLAGDEAIVLKARGGKDA